MDRPGDHRLAGAALAGDQHGGAGVGHAVDHVVDLQHAVVVADDVLHAEAEIELGLERLVLFDHLALVQGPLDGHLQLFVDQRLGEEVEGPQADRLDGRLDRAVAGDHDHGRVRLLLAAMGQQVEAVAVAQADVDQHQVVGLAIDGGDAFGQAGGRIGLVALLAEPVGHRGRARADRRRPTGAWPALLHASHPADSRRRGPSPNIYVTGDDSQRHAKQFVAANIDVTGERSRHDQPSSVRSSMREF